MAEMAASLRASEQRERAKTMEVVHLDSLPDNVKCVLRQFDVDSDGKIDSAEISRAAELLMSEKRKSRTFKYALCAAVACIVALASLNAVTSVVAIEAEKEIFAMNNERFTEPLSTGILASRGGSALASPSMHTVHDLKKLTDIEQIKHVQRVELEMNGKTSIFIVAGFTCAPLARTV